MKATACLLPSGYDSLDEQNGFFYLRSALDINYYTHLLLTLESRGPILSWLTAICPSVNLLPVSTHTCSKLNVHPWRCRESEAFGDFDKIEFVYVEDGAEGM